MAHAASRCGREQNRPTRASSAGGAAEPAWDPDLGRYSPEQARRHDVRPGLTGLAQVSGRNGLSWEDKFRLDLEYIDRQSLWLDVHILILTVGSVARREGISALGQSTASEFRQEDRP